MKIFNIGAIALLTTLPAGAAINTAGQTWEIELNSAEEQFSTLATNLAEQYIGYVEGTETDSRFSLLVSQVQNHHTSFGQDITDYYNTNFASETDTLAAVTKSVSDSYLATSGFALEDLTIAYLGTSLDTNDFVISTSSDENPTITVENPLREIDSIFVESTLMHSTSLPSIGQEYGDPLITFKEGTALSPTRDFLSSWLSDISTITTTILDGYMDSNLYDEGIFKASPQRKLWSVGLDIENVNANPLWNYREITNLGITPVTGSSIIGWLIFALPVIALFGPLVIKKWNDHKMKVIVKKGGN